MQTRIIDIVRTRNNVQRAAVNRRVDLHGASNQIGLFEIRSIEAVTLNGDIALRDLESREIPAGVDDRIAGRENTARRIDEPAAIHDESRRIRDHDIRLPPRDFDIAAQHRRIVAVDLIDDDLRGVVRTEVRIAVDLSGQLCARDERRIVENRTVALHVELRVRIHRYARAGGLAHIHLRNSVRRVDDIRRTGPSRNDLRHAERRRNSERKQNREGRMSQSEQRNGTLHKRRAAFPSTTLTVSNGSLRNRDEHTPQLAEHKPVTTVIHFLSDPGC